MGITQKNHNKHVFMQKGPIVGFTLQEGNEKGDAFVLINNPGNTGRKSVCY